MKRAIPKATTFLTEPGPCHECPLASKCRQYRLACALFWVDAEERDAPAALKSKARRVPTRQVYDMIFSGVEKHDTGKRDGLGRPIMTDPHGLRIMKNAALASLPALDYRSK